MKILNQILKSRTSLILDHKRTSKSTALRWGEVIPIPFTLVRFDNTYRVCKRLAQGWMLVEGELQTWKLFESLAPGHRPPLPVSSDSLCRNTWYVRGARLPAVEIKLKWLGRNHHQVIDVMYLPPSSPCTFLWLTARHPQLISRLSLTQFWPPLTVTPLERCVLIENIFRERMGAFKSDIPARCTRDVWFVRVKTQSEIAKCC